MKLHTIGLIMCLIPFAFLAKPLGIEWQILGLGIQLTGFSIAFGPRAWRWYIARRSRT